MQNKGTFDELKEAAQPLIDFLYKYYNPMCKVIVEMNHVEIIEGLMGIPVQIKD